MCELHAVYFHIRLTRKRAKRLSHLNLFYLSLIFMAGWTDCPVQQLKTSCVGQVFLLLYWAYESSDTQGLYLFKLPFVFEAKTIRFNNVYIYFLVDSMEKMQRVCIKIKKLLFKKYIFFSRGHIYQFKKT